MNKNLLLLTRTAVMLALVVVFQWLGKMLGDAIFPGVGSTILVGSLVNLVLYVTVIYCGVIGAVCVGFLTPVMALFIGQLPVAILIPFVGLGNAILAVVFWAVNKYLKINSSAKVVTGVVAASLLKFLYMGSLLKFLYMGYALVALLPYLVTDALVTKLTAAYGWVQLVAAVVGGIIFFGVWQGLKKAKVQPVSEM